MAYVARLKTEYNERIVSALKEEFGYKNVMQVPKLEKIVVSRGVGAAVAAMPFYVRRATVMAGRRRPRAAHRREHVARRPLSHATRTTPSMPLMRRSGNA